MGDIIFSGIPVKVSTVHVGGTKTVDSVNSFAESLLFFVLNPVITFDDLQEE